MSLSAQIAQFQRERLGGMPAELRNTLMADTMQLIQSGLAAQSVRSGELAPSFALPNALGKTVVLAELLKKGPVVINFYRGAWCPYCNLELRALQEALPLFRALGAQLVAISPNTPDKSLSSIEKHALTYEVLTDAHNALARQYGLVFTMSEAVRPIYQQIGFDIPAHNGDDTWELPFPATYVVDQNGMVVYRFVNADYTKRAEPATVVAVLQALHEGKSFVRAAAKTVIAAPADQVWQTVRDFNGLGQYVAAISQSTQEGAGIGAVRTLTLTDGNQIVEKLESLHEETQTLTYSITSPSPFLGYLSTMQVRPAGNGHAEFTWSSTFVPQGLSAAEAKAQMEGLYALGGAGLQKLHSK